ncbi:MAG: hypothetical protein JWM25_1848, partial [Thermoleophilia bacterium]|nr:hypothetical protein [Thermoleophilia bacterium]
RIKRVIIVCLVAAVGVSLPMSAEAATESGSTSKWPWSGYWWPMLENGYNLYSPDGALQKYDQYLATRGVQGGAQSWERANRSTTDPANSWWGYCHASATAAILAPEPRAVTRNGVNFTINDVKGLTTSLYYEPTFSWLSGNRVDDVNDRSSAAYNDIAPAWMDYLLRYYIRHYKYPFIMDINANSQVWNYPVFAYERSSTAYAGGIEDVTTTVWYTSPDWSTTGTRYFSKRYTYRLQSGTLGQWTGASANDHPDFAWVPTGKRPSGNNPYVTEGHVEAITGLDV